MNLIYTKKYSSNSNTIKEIIVNKFPLIIITDTHTNIASIEKIRKLYPKNQIICLGDITFAFDKITRRNSQSIQSRRNSQSIQYFLNKKIPCLRGNHDDFIADSTDFDITYEEKEYLKNLPIGFKLVLPNGKNYLCYHNRPEDLWSFTEEAFKEFAFIKTYPVENNTLGVLIGHNHRHFIIDFPNINAKLICVGRLKKDNEYALLDENGVQFKKI